MKAPEKHTYPRSSRILLFCPYGTVPLRVGNHRAEFQHHKGFPKKAEPFLLIENGACRIQFHGKRDEDERQKQKNKEYERKNNIEYSFDTAINRFGSPPVHASFGIVFLFYIHHINTPIHMTFAFKSYHTKNSMSMIYRKICLYLFQK